MADLISVHVTDEVFGAPLGIQPVQVHDAAKCAGQACCIHNPSDHHMRTWPQLWRADRYLMERTCPHGVAHPDPDDLSGDTIHGCDGCCERPGDEEGESGG